MMMGIGIDIKLQHDGYSNSIFMEVEAMLEEREYQKSLEFVAARKNMDRYVSVVDFLFCELFGHPWIRLCLKYYEDEGDPLRKLITEEERAVFEKRMLHALKMAHLRFSEHRKCSWNWFRLEALAVAA